MTPDERSRAGRVAHPDRVPHGLPTEDLADTSIFGTPMAQAWADIWIWERRIFPVYAPSVVIEIGTAHGGLSLYLALQCRARGISFRTFDIAYPAPTPLVAEFVLPHFTQGDVFQHRDLVMDGVAAAGRTCLFCDGGDKAREYRTFAPLLKPGDIVGVHDFPLEFTPQDEDGSLTAVIEADVCEILRSATRWMVRR